MGWLDPLRGDVVAVDSAPLIYYIEENPNYLPALIPFFELVDQGEVRCVTSVVTITEVLVLPIRNGRADVATKYRDILLGSQRITAIAVDETIAERAAAIRASHNLRTPDAIHLATALQTGATVLVTNDAKVKRFPGVTVLLLDDVVAAE